MRPQRHLSNTNAGLLLLGIAVLLLLSPALVAAEEIDLSGPWMFRADWAENGLAEQWQGLTVDQSQWRAITVPGAWEQQEVTKPNPRYPSTEPGDGYNGYAWYRRTFSVPADWTGGDLVLSIGAIADTDWAFINGTQVGCTTRPPDESEQARSYPVPAGLLKLGQENVIAIRVCDTGGPGGIISSPVKLVRAEPVLDTAAPDQPSEPERVYSKVREDIVNVGGSVTVPADMKVEGDAVAVGGSVEVFGYVTGDVTAIAGSVYLSEGSVVDGSAVAIGGSVEQAEDAVVRGSVTEITVVPASVLKLLLARSGRFDRLPRHGHRTGTFGNVLVGLFITLIAVLLFPRRTAVMASALRAQPGRVALTGAAGLVLTPAFVMAAGLLAAFTIVVLAITIVGLLLVPAVAAALFAGLLGIGVMFALGAAALWLALGRTILDQFGHRSVHAIWPAILGLLILAFASSLPAVGPLVIISTVLFGFGVAVMTGVGSDEDWLARRFGSRRAPPPQPVPTAPQPPLPATAPVVASEPEPQPDVTAQPPPAEESAPQPEATGDAAPELEPMPQTGEQPESPGESDQRPEGAGGPDAPAPETDQT